MKKRATICDENDYYFINMKGNTWGIVIGEQIELVKFYNQDNCYQYTCFLQLMEKLKKVATKTHGFWFNRHIILQNVAHLTIVVEKTTKQIVAFYIILPENDQGKSVIDFFQVFTPGKGLGKMIIDKEMIRPGLSVQDALASSVGFWEKMGIPYDHVTYD